ncbi:SMC-Scp complex subunit ScpB [Tomitella fengzijianii]|uniref:SMC-Scp complex subunit ScpB n=1 Tax=Tomitella fengzijianii TaxID=2597660 RepID=A0A516X3T5_9ACTN|nr:SMC-Scp complex subunit ScpB [Tomitella fengzijianii]QDQ97311.1 SMC-Scp complex subunit ScpB [Tomitella fengzijianii]
MTTAGDAGGTDGAGGADADAAPLTDERVDAIIESLLLVADSPVPAEVFADVLDVPQARAEERLASISRRYDDTGGGMDLRFTGDGWRLFTRTENAPYVERLLLDGTRATLTRAALETLAVIAYRQPVTRTRVAAVRGVNADGVMRTLVARGLITEAGPDPETRGTLYTTTGLFLERLGLDSLEDLPPLAPLLPDEDVIEYIGDNLDDDPRVMRMHARSSSTEENTTEIDVDEH